MSIATIFDQTIPYVSGYSMRSRYITDSLAELGVTLSVFSSPIFPYEHSREQLNGVDYYRTSVSAWNLVGRIPVIKECAIIQALASNIVRQPGLHIQLIHAHSSLLNGLAAVRVARQRKIPFVYEIRALWEDAAVDQGKTSEAGFR